MSYNINRVGIIIENNRREFLLIKDNTTDKLKFPFRSVIHKYSNDSLQNEIYTMYYLLIEKIGIDINNTDSLFYRKKMRLRQHYMFYSLYYNADTKTDMMTADMTTDMKDNIYGCTLNNITNDPEYIIRDFTEKHTRGVITKYNYECNCQYFWMNEDDIRKNIKNVNIDVRNWIDRDDKYLESIKTQ